MGAALISLTIMGCSKPASQAPRIYSAEELNVEQPGRSNFSGLNGLERLPVAHAKMLCTIDRMGVLEACSVEQFEGPLGGAAHQALIQGFIETAQSTRVNTRAKDGSDARGQRYRVGVRWQP